jgi:hypothetical protein
VAAAYIQCDTVGSLIPATVLEKGAAVIMAMLLTASCAHPERRSALDIVGLAVAVIASNGVVCEWRATCLS